jgi:hypothetical protein
LHNTGEEEDPEMDVVGCRLEREWRPGWCPLLLREVMYDVSSSSALPPADPASYAPIVAAVR